MLSCRTSGLVGYDVCLTRRRSPVRSRACVLLPGSASRDPRAKSIAARQTGASIAQMVERKTLNLVVVGSIPTGGAIFASTRSLCDRAGEDRPVNALTVSRFSSVGRASD